MHKWTPEIRLADEWAPDGAAKDDALVTFRAARAAHEHASQAADHAWELAEDARAAWDEARNRGWSAAALSHSDCYRLPEIRWRPTGGN